VSTSRNQAVLHAIDLATLGDIDAAKRELEMLDGPVAGRLLLLLIESEDRQERERRARAVLRHEVGNALSIVQSNIEGILDGVLAPDRRRLEGIREAVVDAGRLIGEAKSGPMLGERTQTTIRLATFNICALIGAHCAAAAGLAESKGIRIEYATCGVRRTACENYYGDATRVGQILRNILVNAVRYTPPGGIVALHCDQAGANLLVQISDTGPGIGFEDLDRVFEAGFRGGNADTAGSGLGLAVVRRLTDELGGEVEVISQPGVGATFRIALPMLSLAAPAQA